MDNQDALTPSQYAKMVGMFPDAPHNPLPTGGYMDEGFDWVVHQAESFGAESKSMFGKDKNGKMYARRRNGEIITHNAEYDPVNPFILGQTVWVRVETQKIEDNEGRLDSEIAGRVTGYFTSEFAALKDAHKRLAQYEAIPQRFMNDLTKSKSKITVISHLQGNTVNKIEYMLTERHGAESFMAEMDGEKLRVGSYDFDDGSMMVGIGTEDNVVDSPDFMEMMVGEDGKIDYFSLPIGKDGFQRHYQVKPSHYGKMKTQNQTNETAGGDFVRTDGDGKYAHPMIPQGQFMAETFNAEIEYDGAKRYARSLDSKFDGANDEGYFPVEEDDFSEMVVDEIGEHTTLDAETFNAECQACGTARLREDDICEDCETCLGCCVKEGFCAESFEAAGVEPNKPYYATMHTERPTTVMHPIKCGHYKMVMGGTGVWDSPTFYDSIEEMVEGELFDLADAILAETGQNELIEQYKNLKTVGEARKWLSKTTGTKLNFAPCFKKEYGYDSKALNALPITPIPFDWFDAETFEAGNMMKPSRDWLSLALGTAAVVIGGSLFVQNRSMFKADGNEGEPSLVAHPSTGDLLPADYEEMIVESTGYAVPIIPISLDPAFMGSRFHALPTNRVVESNEPGIGAHTDVAMTRDTDFREPEQSMITRFNADGENCKCSLIEKLKSFITGKSCCEGKQVKEANSITGQTPYFGVGFDGKNTQTRVIKETNPVSLDPSTTSYIPQNLSGYTGQAYTPPTVYSDMMDIGVSGQNPAFVSTESSSLQSVHGNLSAGMNQSYTDGSRTMSLSQWSIDYDVSQTSDSEAFAVSRSSGVRTMIRRV